MSGEGTDKSSTSSAIPSPIYYGDKLRLWTVSAYATQEMDRIGGYLGAYYKTDKFGAMMVVPPLGHPYNTLYEPSTFTVVDPEDPTSFSAVASATEKPVHATHVASKDMARTKSESNAGSDTCESTFHSSNGRRALRYGDELMLVDQEGLCWNSNQGLNGAFIGPRPVGSIGDAVLSFIPPAGKHIGDTVALNDNSVAIDVVRSLRRTTAFNQRVRNYKASDAEILGGYLTTDGAGTELLFSIRPADTVLGTVAMVRSKQPEENVQIKASRLPTFDRAFYAAFAKDGYFPDGIPVNQTASSFAEALTARVGEDGSVLGLGRFAPSLNEELVPVFNVTNAEDLAVVDGWGSEIGLYSSSQPELPEDAVLVIAVPDVGTARIPLFALEKPTLYEVNEGDDDDREPKAFLQKEFPLEGPYPGSIVKVEWSCTKITVMTEASAPQPTVTLPQTQTYSGAAAAIHENEDEVEDEKFETPEEPESVVEKKSAPESSESLESSKSPETTSMTAEEEYGIPKNVKIAASAACVAVMGAAAVATSYFDFPVEIAVRVAITSAVGAILVNAPIYGRLGAADAAKAEAAMVKKQQQTQPTETTAESSADGSLLSSSDSETTTDIVTVSSDSSTSTSPVSNTVDSIVPEKIAEVSYIWSIRVWAPRNESCMDLSVARFRPANSVRSLTEDKVTVAQILQAIRSSVFIAAGEDVESGTSDSSSHRLEYSSNGSVNGSITRAPASSVVLQERNAKVTTKGRGNNNLSETRFTVSSPHPQIGSTLEVSDYEPNLFKRIRDTHGVTPQDFADSWTYAIDDIPELTLGAGRSGQLFLTSADNRFLFKTVTEADLITLKAVLSDYAEYVCTRPSRLMKFLGLLRLSFNKGTQVQYIVIATNMFSLGTDIKPPVKKSRTSSVSVLNALSRKNTGASFANASSFHAIPEVADEDDDSVEEKFPNDKIIAGMMKKSTSMHTGPTHSSKSGKDEIATTAASTSATDNESDDEYDTENDSVLGTLSIGQMFDLKGRKPKKPSHLRPNESNRGIWKDNQLARVFNLHETTHASVIKTLRADVAFLRDHDMIDYSLLVGVAATADKYIPPSLSVPMPDEKVGIAPVILSADQDGELFTVGIIDFLSRYQTFKKKAAHFIKSFRWKDEELSTVNAPFYSQRFSDYIDVVFPAPTDIVVSSLDELGNKASKAEKERILAALQKKSGTGGISTQISTGETIVVLPEGVKSAPRLPSSPNPKALK